MPERLDSAVAPRLDLDPFSDEFLSDPYPYHERIREAGPVVWLERYELWATARFEQVHATLRDWETFCSSAGVGLSDFRKEAPWRPPSIILEADPPEHTRARAVLTRVLSVRAIEVLRETFQQEAERLVGALVAGDQVAKHGVRFDAIESLAQAFPLKVFADAVGLPADGRENLLAYGNMVFNALGPRNRLFDDAMAQAEPVREWIAHHCSREILSETGLGAQIYQAADDGELTQDEAALLVRSLLSAGLDTTVIALGNAIYCFATHPEQWQRLREDPGLARSAFDEGLRLESPAQTFFRTTTRRVNLAGADLPAHAKILLFLGAANRDPRRWEDPEKFDIERKVAGHVGLGSGIHACVGQSLARLEAECLLGTLARHVAAIELDGEPVRRLHNTLRGFDVLPVALTPA